MSFSALEAHRRRQLVNATWPELLADIERYNFACLGGPLENSLPWQELRRRVSLSGTPVMDAASYIVGVITGAALAAAGLVIVLVLR